MPGSRSLLGSGGGVGEGMPCSRSLFGVRVGIPVRGGDTGGRYTKEYTRRGWVYQGVDTRMGVGFTYPSTPYMGLGFGWQTGGTYLASNAFLPFLFVWHL